MLYDRGNGLIYDSVQNITWLKDFSYAQNSGALTGSYHAWSEANTWAANLTYAGYSDWRLPRAKLIGDYSRHPNESESQWMDRVKALYESSYDGSTDRGFNNKRGELGHLFFELGNRATFDASGNAQPGGLAHTGPFQNMQAALYYEGDTFVHYSGEAYVWAFDFSKGYHTGVGQATENPSPLWIAVRDGDVAHAAAPSSPTLKVS